MEQSEFFLPRVQTATTKSVGTAMSALINVRHALLQLSALIAQLATISLLTNDTSTEETVTEMNLKNAMMEI